MSRSFAILLREARQNTPDPEKEGKSLTQKRLADILDIHVQTLRYYEWGQRIPHPTIRKEIFRLFPSISNTV